MRALVLDRYGPPEVLHVSQREQPSVEAGKVLVRVRFSGVNPIDVGVRAGKVLPDEAGRFPMVLGWDGAGVVEVLGKGINDLSIGDRVMLISKQPSSGVGLHAEFASVPIEHVVRLNDSVGLDVAAATPLAAITALNAVQALRLSPGARVHVNNVHGAVGSFAAQIARCLGLNVIDEPTPQSVDGAVDVRGGRQALPAFDTVQDGGAFTTVIPEWWKPGGIYAPARGITPIVVENAPTRSDLTLIAGWLADGQIAPRIEAVLPLAEGAESHRRLEAPGLTGKFVLDHDA